MGTLHAIQPDLPSSAAEILRSLAGRYVYVRMRDGEEFDGLLRTELLGEASVSVFIAGRDRAATLPIDLIADIST